MTLKGFFRVLSNTRGASTPRAFFSGRALPGVDEEQEQQPTEDIHCFVPSFGSKPAARKRSVCFLSHFKSAFARASRVRLVIGFHVFFMTQ